MDAFISKIYVFILTCLLSIAWGFHVTQEKKKKLQWSLLVHSALNGADESPEASSRIQVFQGTTFLFLNILQCYPSHQVRML